MRVHVVDPSAYTPAYDHALCAALAREGADVELITSGFAYGSAPAPDGYERVEAFYRSARGAPGSRLRRIRKLLQHPGDMRRYRGLAAGADVVHFQWLALQWLDRHLLPRRPTVLTAHDLLPREPRPFQTGAQRRLYDAVDAVVTHSEYGRGQLVDALGVESEKVHVIHHGAFEHLTHVEPVVPAELQPAGGSSAGDAPVVLFFGLLRPYKGLAVLLEAWRMLEQDRQPAAELWVVGRPRMRLDGLPAPASARFVPRFVSDAELAGCFRRADAVVLPYLRTERLDFSGVLATALAFGKPAVVTEVGSFAEVAAAGAAVAVPPGDPERLGAALRTLLADRSARERLAAGAQAAAAGPYSWAEAARRTLELYRALAS